MHNAGLVDDQRDGDGGEQTLYRLLRERFSVQFNYALSELS